MIYPKHLHSQNYETILIQSTYSIFFKCVVPAITPVTNSPQPKLKKPTNEHPNEYEEHHALLQPQKVQNKNDKHAKKGKNEKNRHSGNSETTADRESEIENEIDAGIKEILEKCGRNVKCLSRKWKKRKKCSRNKGCLSGKWRKRKTCGRNRECFITGKSNKGGASRSKKVIAYRNVGCYKDALPRAVPLLEGQLCVLTYDTLD